MEISLDTIIAILGLFIGGGSGAFFTWRWQRRKAKAEAKTAEADTAKELQDVYSQLINDIKADRDEQKAYIQELKEDRRHLRKDVVSITAIELNDTEPETENETETE